PVALVEAVVGAEAASTQVPVAGGQLTLLAPATPGTTPVVLTPLGPEGARGDAVALSIDVVADTEAPLLVAVERVGSGPLVEGGSLVVAATVTSAFPTEHVDVDLVEGGVVRASQRTVAEPHRVSFVLPQGTGARTVV